MFCATKFMRGVVVFLFDLRRVSENYLSVSVRSVSCGDTVFVCLFFFYWLVSSSCTHRPCVSSKILIVNNYYNI